MKADKPLRVLVVGLGNEHITFLDRFINGLISRGMEVTIASSAKPAVDKFLHPERVHWLRSPSWSVSLVKRAINLIGLCVVNLPSKRARWLKNQVLAQNTAGERILQLYTLLPFTRAAADVIYFPWNASAISYKALNQLGIPVVLSCRGSQINIRPLMPDADRYKQELSDSFAAAAAVHCVSEDILENSISLGLDPQKAVVIRPAVNPQFFEPGKDLAENHTFTIITTGSLIWRKGYEYALLAIKELVDHGLECCFEIIGSGPEKARLLYTIQDLGLQGCVALHGKLSPEEIKHRLQQADVFLLSSLSEGISNAALEAMSCGLPVVTTDCGGMREAVTSGVEGYVVPLRDAPAMALALQSLAADPALRVRMGLAARERVLKDFQIDQQISAFEKLFNKTTTK